MSKNFLCVLFKFAIVVCAICGICICGCFYPFLVSLNGWGKGSEVVMWTQIIFYWGTSIPWFWLLWIAWRVASSMKLELFTLQNARLLKNGAILLFVDSVIFLFGNLIFMFMGYNPFAIAFFLLVIVSLIASLALGAMGYYVAKASALREENESYV